jgi:hypothetical protein
MNEHESLIWFTKEHETLNVYVDLEKLCLEEQCKNTFK